MEAKTKRPSRHGKNSPDTIKLSCKTDYETWRRVTKASESSDADDVASWLRKLITEAVWDIDLTDEDYEIIKRKKAEKKASGK